MGHNEKKVNKSAVAVLAVCVIAAIACVAVLILQKRNVSSQEETYQSLANNTVSTESGQDGSESKDSGEGKAADETASSSLSEAEELRASYEKSLQTLKELGIPVPEKEIDFEKLQKETNPDIYAWIYIPDSVIDYPVLQHPSDNTYYLDYNIDGTKGYPGCIYTENYNSKDFTDPVTVMYGHNMKNGTMFAGLHKFEDKDYFDSTKYVYIYTPQKLFVYEVFSAFLADDAHILLNNDFYDQKNLQRYIDIGKNLKGMNVNNREGLEVTYENHILTLSTCSTSSRNRYLVQGVLLNED
mgnify:CR=1 FL=1